MQTAMGPVSMSTVTLNAGGGHVTIRPLDTVIEKILLKAVSKSSKKDSKVFSLRFLDSTHTNCKKVKEGIRRQLPDDIIEDDFELGVVQGSTVVSIRSQSDLYEFFSHVRQGIKVTLWCNGLKVIERRQKRKRALSDSESEDEEEDRPAKKKRKSKKECQDEKIETTIGKLKEKHNASYTHMQYRIWSEMIVGGIYDNYVIAPSSSMFVRAGGTTPKRKKEANTDSSEVVEVLKSLMSAASSSPNLAKSSPSQSPLKMIDGRSKCYKQLADLSNLKDSGILTVDEFKSEKEAIMLTLKSI